MLSHGRGSRVITLLLLVGSVSLATGQPQEFRIVVERQKIQGNLIVGTITVNGVVIGNTYENNDLKITSGTFPGLLRYWSEKNFVQGPFGTIGNVGDFLVEATVPRKTGILFHGGNKAKHSTGCILLGAVGKDPTTGIPVLDNNHPLVRLRAIFYGTDVPNATPDKNITVEIRDIKRDVSGTWDGTMNTGGVTTHLVVQFSQTGGTLSGQWQVSGMSGQFGNGQISGNNVSFELVGLLYKFSGTVSDNLSSMSGSLSPVISGTSGTLVLQKRGPP